MMRSSSSLNLSASARTTALACLSAALVVFYPDMAYATTFGQLLCNARLTGDGYAVVLNAGSFIAGLFLVVRGILLAKKHGENPNDSQVVKSVAHIVGGGTLMSLPSAAGVIQRTVFGAGGGAGDFGCTPGAVATAGSLDVMMQNFVNNIYDPMISLVSVLSVIIGATFIARGLLRGSKVGSDPRAGDPKSILTHLIIGAVLISMGTTLPDVLRSLFGGSASISDVTNYAGIQWSNFVGTGVDTTAADNTVRAILAFIQIIGVISFLRGWLIIKAAMEGGQATIPQGITHIVGGAMAVNIDVMIGLLDDTFGTGIVS